MKIRLESKDLEWINKKWIQVRKAQQLADQANNDWKRVSAEINSYLDRSEIRDPVQRMRIRNESLALKDALDVGNWHSRNAERHIADVQLFLRLREMEVL
jgi:hypothetical protein